MDLSRTMCRSRALCELYRSLHQNMLRFCSYRFPLQDGEEASVSAVPLEGI